MMLALSYMGREALVAPEQMGPMMATTLSEISLVAALVASSGLHWSSWDTSSMFLPSTPPLALASSMTILAALRLGTPYEARSPEWAPCTPILMVSAAMAGAATATLHSAAMSQVMHFFIFSLLERLHALPGVAQQQSDVYLAAV